MRLRSRPSSKGTPRSSASTTRDSPATRSTPSRAGTISFRDQDVTGKDSHTTANLGIGQVAEGRQVFRKLDIGSRVDLARVFTEQSQMAGHGAGAPASAPPGKERVR